MQEDFRPWYKQFWPWFLISIPATSVILSMFMLTKATQSGLSVVNDEYYKEGLAINKTLDAIQYAESLAIQAEISIIGRHLILRIRGNKGLSVDKIHAVFSHPFNKAFDQAIQFEQKADYYHAVMPNLDKGKWYLDLVATGSDAFRLKTVFFHPFKTLSISG